MMDGINAYSSAPPSGFLRTLPQNDLAEKSVIGGIMTNSKNLNEVFEFLQPHHFADPLHGRIFGEQRRRIMAGGIADAVSLNGWFGEDPEALSVGGTSYLGRLIVSYIAGGTMAGYGHAIVDDWMRREIIAAGDDVTNAGFNREQSAHEAVACAISRLDATNQPESAARATSLDQAMDAAITAADLAAQSDGPAGISTGFPSIDTALGGLEPGSLTVIAGRPGMGKTAIGWQIAIAAARQGVSVLAVSLEMSATELGRRALSTASGVPVGTMKQGSQTMEQAEAMVKAQQEMRGLPLTIEDGGGLSPIMIAMKARSVRRRHGIGLVMVDHLHIMVADAADARHGPTHAIGAASAAMKRMAKELDCPVLLLAQLNRGVEARDDKRPGLGDLRQSGGIEQDADAVLFVYRPEYYLKAEPEQREGESGEKFRARSREFHESVNRIGGKAEIIVAKVRDGEMGTIPLEFHGPTTSFREIGGVQKP